MPSSDSRSGWFTHFLMAACVILAVVVVMLVRTNKSLKVQNATLRSQADKALLEASLRAGEPLKALTLETPDGKPAERRFDAGGKSTVLLVISGGCEACASNIQAWVSVLAGPHEACDPILVSIDTLPTDEKELAGLTAERFIAVNARSTVLGGLRIVPATILIGPDGVIDSVWYGTLTQETMREVAEAIAQPAS